MPTAVPIRLAQKIGKRSRGHVVGGQGWSHIDLAPRFPNSSIQFVVLVADKRFIEQSNPSEQLLVKGAEGHCVDIALALAGSKRGITHAKPTAQHSRRHLGAEIAAA